jgi:SAM-dependent methyltransferase
MKLSIGCGNRRLEGYTGVDAVQRDAVDIVAPATKIPLADGVADEVLAVHLIEHLLPWHVPDALAEWFRLLKPGGLLVMEQPDFLKSCRNIAEGIKGRKHPDQLGMWGCYGDPRDKDEFMMHRWGYWFDSLKPLVDAAGFIGAVEKETFYHRPGRGVRDFRLEAFKPK